MVNARRRREGKARLGCLVAMLLFGATLYFAMNIGSAVLRYIEFQDAMATEARFAARNGNEVILARLRAKADSLDMPEGAKRIQIRRKGNQIWIWAEYTELIEMPGFVKEVELSPHVERAF